MHRISIGLLVAGVIAFAPALTHAVELSATQDTFTDAAAPATNYGSTDALRVRKTGNRMALIRFDLDQVPAGQQPAAVLKVRVDTVSAGGLIEVRRVLSDWQEGTVTFNTPLIVSPEVVTTYEVTPADAGQTISLDITGLVAEWARQPTKNFGVAVSAGSYSRAHVFFASREHDGAPMLSIPGLPDAPVALSQVNDAERSREAQVAVETGTSVAGEAVSETAVQFFKR